jgi:hypothetical protein
VVLEACALVDKPVALLGCQIAAPVRDFDIALQQCRVGEGLGELVTDAYELLGTCGHVAVKTVCEGRALFLGIGRLLVVELGGEGGVVWHIAVGELDLGSLLLSEVGRGCVCAEVILKVLLVGLSELGGDGFQSRENRVRDAESLLCLGCEWFGEMNLVEFNRAVFVRCQFRSRNAVPP